MTQPISLPKADPAKGGIKNKKHYVKMMICREAKRGLAPVTLPYVKFLEYKEHLGV